MQSIRAKEADSRLPPTSLTKLTSEMKAMKDDAWTKFHSLYFPRMYAYALTLHGGNRAEAEDTVQSAFLRMVRNIRRFEDDDILWSWLALLLRCAAADQGRKASTRVRTLAALIEEAPSPLWRRPKLSNSKLIFLEEALNELKEEDRILLLEKYSHGETVEKIASRHAMTPKAVECRLRRLRRKLKSRIHALSKQYKL